MAVNVGELFATIGLRDTLSPGLRRAVNNLRQAAADFGEHTGRISAGTTLAMARLGASVTLAAAKLALLGAAAAATANGVVSLGAALGPAVGAVAALPGAVALGVAALATLRVALLGVGEAFEAALGNDQAKFEKALAGLSPAAQSAARELRALKPVLDGIRLVVQDALFAPLAGQLTAVVSTLAGPFVLGMQSVASAIGDAARMAAEFARSAVAVDAVATVFAALRQIIWDLTPAIVPVLTGMTRLAQVGAAFAVSLTPEVTRLAIRFGEFLTAAADSGRALGWLQGAVAVFRQLAQIAGLVWGIVSGVFQAMRAAGGDALGVIGAVLAQIDAFVNSAQGQATLTSIFVAMHQAALALGPVIASLAVGVGVLAPILGRLATQVGPILTSAIQALVPALAALGPALVVVFAALGQAVAAVGPALTPLARAFAALLVAVSPLLPVVAQVAALIATALAGGVRAVLPSLVDLAAVVAYQLVPAALPLVPIIVQLAQQVGVALLQALVALSPQLVSIIGSFVAFLVAIQPVLPPLLQLVVGVLPPLVGLIEAAARLLRGDFTGAIGVAAGAIGQLLIIVGNLGWNLLVGLWNGIVAAASWFRDVIYNFFRNIMPDWVRRALGIASPSKVFADIGANTMLGMAQGMQNSSRKVLTTAADIAGRLSRSFNADLAANLTSTGQTVTGRSRAGGAVIHVTAINPQAETTSETVNRGLQYAGLMGVI